MPALTNELRDFHLFLGEKLNNGGAGLSPEEALDEWRRLHPDERLFADDTAAIAEALNEIANGNEGTSFEEFDREFRLRHCLPVKP